MDAGLHHSIEGELHVCLERPDLSQLALGFVFFCRVATYRHVALGVPCPPRAVGGLVLQLLCCCIMCIASYTRWLIYIPSTAGDVLLVLLLVLPLASRINNADACICAERVFKHRTRSSRTRRCLTRGPTGPAFPVHACSLMRTQTAPLGIQLRPRWLRCPNASSSCPKTHFQRLNMWAAASRCGSMLLCDGDCARGFHCHCLTPALPRPPKWCWYCSEHVRFTSDLT